MLRLLRLCAIMALLLCFCNTGMADSETFRVKFMGTPVSSTIPFGTKNVKMLFGNTYTTGADWKNNSRTINGETVYTVNCGDDAKLADGISNPKGKVPAKGCYYSFLPLKDGVITVKLATDASEKDLYIISADDEGNSSPVFDALCSTSKNTVLEYDVTGNCFKTPVLDKSEENPSKNEFISISCRFKVTAGTQYYIYAGGTKIGFAGYDFTLAGETETLAFTKTDDPNKYVGTTKTFENPNVKLTLGEDGTADATKQWRWEERTGYIIYLSGNNADKNNTPPTSGCYNKFTAESNGTLIVKLVTSTDGTKSFKIVDGDGNDVTAICTSNGQRLAVENGNYKLIGYGNKVYGLTSCEFNVEAGTDYYVYSTGTKLGFAGYDFIPAGATESLAVSEGNKPGKTYQSYSREEEKTQPATLSTTPALYITLGNGVWKDPIKIADTKTKKDDQSNAKDFDADGNYILNSHFEYEIIPDKASVPTDGSAAYVFDGNENNSLPVTGAFYTITAMKTGTVYLYFDKDDKKKFGMLWITDSKGNAVDTYPNGIYSDEAAGGTALYNKTQSFMFHATAGTTYYVFNSMKQWGADENNAPNRLGLAGVIYSDGETNIKDVNHYNLMNGNVHEVGDQIKVPGMVMTFGGQDKKNNIYTMAKQDDSFIKYDENDNSELRFGYATAGNENPSNEMRDIDGAKRNFIPNGNTHVLPYYGTFYKFEPQCSGELTVHVLQNGALDLDENGNPSADVTGNKTLKIRPLYIADEKGNTINGENVEVKVNGKLKKAAADFAGYGNYDIYKDAWEKANEGGSFEAVGHDNGYVLINKAYCKYIFDVHPGKTYFIFANGSKVGLCGYKFIPAENNAVAECTLDDQSTTAPMFNENTDVTINYPREFKADTWMPVTLPYSMTETQVERTFGNGTMVIYFDGIEGNTIKFKKHNYQMIVAGRPCFVRPTQSGTGFGPAADGSEIKGSLANVTIDGATIEPAVNGKDSGTLNGKFNFTLKASYEKLENALLPNDYYFGGDGKLYRTQEGENFSIKGYRSFLKCSDNTSGAKAMIAGADFGEDSGTTAIDHITGDTGVTVSANAVIYDMNGRKVAVGTEGLTNLMKGVYIVNGKKVIIK